LKKHRANLMRKLGLHNAADVTRFALNHHLIAQEGGVVGASEMRKAFGP